MAQTLMLVKALKPVRTVIFNACVRTYRDTVKLLICLPSEIYYSKVSKGFSQFLTDHMKSHYIFIEHSTFVFLLCM